MCTYLLVRWVPIPKAQLRQRETAVASDPTQVRSILAPAHVSGSQRFCREMWHHNSASDQHEL